MNKICYTILLFFFTIYGFSQSDFSISGSVFNKNQQIIKEGKVFLFRDEIADIVKADIIKDGKFSFNSLSAGRYIVKVVGIGYEDLLYSINLTQSSEIKLILSETAFTELKEIVIKNDVKTFSYSDGNIKVDIASSIFKTASNPVDLLSKLPNILISPDKESLSVVGRGNPLIYIDNQKVGMNDLSTLSIEDIKTIEIINNPSSKYEAEGRAVILIKKKISKREGFVGTVSNTSSFKKRFNNYSRINLDFKKGKTEFKVNFNYNYLNPWESISNDFSIPNEGISTNFLAESYTKRHQYIYGGSVYHQLNEDDYLSFSINGRIQNDGDKNTTNTYILQDSQEDNIITLNNNNETRNFFNSFVNYNKKIKSLNATFFTGLQFSNFDQDSKSVIQNNYNSTQFELEQNRNQSFKVKVFSGRADFEKLFDNEMKWETGMLLFSADANSKVKILDFVDDNNSVNTDYNYKEKNSASYTQLSGKIGKSKYSIGLRAENTDISGKYSNQDNFLIKKNYTNLFPKFQYDVPIDSTKSVSVNYAKSIIRPNYSSTSQISIYTNPFVVYSRNINLNPSITDEISTTFQYKSSSVRLRYYHTSDPTYFSYSYDEAANLISFNMMNYKKESGFNVECYIPYQYKAWSSDNSINVTLNKIEDPAAVINSAKPYLYVYSNNTFKLPKGYSFSLTGWGLTDRNEGVIKRSALFIMDISISKTFFNSINCNLSFNDVFRNMNYSESLNINNIYSRGYYYTDTREIALSISYKFGTIKNSSYKQRNVNENENRIR